MKNTYCYSKRHKIWSWGSHWCLFWLIGQFLEITISLKGKQEDQAIMTSNHRITRNGNQSLDNGRDCGRLKTTSEYVALGFSPNVDTSPREYVRYVLLSFFGAHISSYHRLSHFLNTVGSPHTVYITGVSASTDILRRCRFAPGGYKGTTRVKAPMHWTFLMDTECQVYFDINRVESYTTQLF